MLQRSFHVVDLTASGSDNVRLTAQPGRCRRSLCRLSAIALLVGAMPGLPAASSPKPPPSYQGSRPIAQVNFEELEDFEYWQRLCQLQTAAGKYEEAQQACERAIEIRPENASIWADHSGVLLRLEKYPEAIASADLSLTYNLENSLAFTYQCIAFQAMGDYETALDKCNEALRIDGDWGTESPSLAWRYRGQLLDQQGDFEQALVAYERTLLLQPEDSLTLTYQCQTLIHLERYDAAIAACQEALVGNQDWGQETSSLAWFYQGLARSQAGQYGLAVAAFDQAIAADPNRADTWTQQGWALEQLNQPTEALTSYTRAVELSPESSQALVGQCTMLNQLAQYEAALASCQQAIQGDGNWWPVGPAQAWSEQAQALTGTGMLEEALAASNRAVGIRPDYADAWSDRSVVLWHLGNSQGDRQQAFEQYELAASSARRALELAPQAARTWANLGRILRSQGQLLADVGNAEQARFAYQQSQSAYEEALALQDDDADLWSNYSVVLWLLGRHGEALESIEQSLRLDAYAAQAWQNRGAILVALGQYERARTSYEQAVRLDDQNAVAWASLGVIQLQLSRGATGAEALQRALELDPEQPLAQRAMEQLSPGQ